VLLFDRGFGILLGSFMCAAWFMILLMFLIKCLSSRRLRQRCATAIHPVIQELKLYVVVGPLPYKLGPLMIFA